MSWQSSCNTRVKKFRNSPLLLHRYSLPIRPRSSRPPLSPAQFAPAHTLIDLVCLRANYHYYHSVSVRLLDTLSERLTAYSFAKERDGLSIRPEPLPDLFVVCGDCKLAQPLLAFELFYDGGILCSFSLVVGAAELVCVVRDCAAVSCGRARCTY